MIEWKSLQEVHLNDVRSLLEMGKRDADRAYHLTVRCLYWPVYNATRETVIGGKNRDRERGVAAFKEGGALRRMPFAIDWLLLSQGRPRFFPCLLRLPPCFDS